MHVYHCISVVLIPDSEGDSSQDITENHCIEILLPGRGGGGGGGKRKEEKKGKIEKYLLASCSAECGGFVAICCVVVVAFVATCCVVVVAFVAPGSPVGIALECTRPVVGRAEATATSSNRIATPFIL